MGVFRGTSACLRKRLGVLAWLTLLSVVGCGQEEAPPVASVSDSVERGPLTYSVEASPKEVWVGDKIRVDLHVHTPDDYLVQFPAADVFGDMGATVEKESAPRPGAEGGLDWQRTFKLTPLVSGALEIPPLAIKYARKTADTNTEPEYEHELVTGSLKVDVRSALTTQDSVMQPRDVTGTLLPAKPPMSPWKQGLIAGAIAGALAGAYAGYRAFKRRMARPAPPILPEVWALRALSELAMTELIETGRAREYYYRLSEIVRGYIEKKFRLAAPDMTTEEFLNTLARNRRALPYDADRLREFLEACDIVKYAAFDPRKEDADQALSSARAFVDATASAAAREAAQQAATPADTGGGQAA